MTLIAAVVLGAASPARAQSSAPLTLEEAITTALRQNRDLDRLGLAEDEALADVKTARSQRLPRFNTDVRVMRLLRPVDVTFPGGAFGTFPGIGAVPAIDTTLTTPANTSVLLDASVAQPITGLIQANLGVQLSETSLALKQEDSRAARLTLVRAVRQTYYAILEATAALESVDANGRLLAEMGRVASNRVAQRVVLKSESFELDARLAQNELGRVKLRHAIASAKEQLNLLLGRDVSTAFDVVPLSEMTPASVEGLPGTQLDRRPDVRQAGLHVKLADLAVRLAKADAIPEVDFAVQAISPMNIDGAPKRIASAGIQVKWEPFDWGRRARAVAARRLELEQAERRRLDVEDGARLEIARASRAVEEAQAALTVAELSRRTAEERTRTRLNQFDTQAVLLVDVLQAQAAFAESSNQVHQALLTLLSARADLDHALGEELVP